MRLGLNSAEALIWEVKSSKIIILGRGKSRFENWKELVSSADEAVSAAEKGLPEGKLVEKVIFGLPADYTSEDKIKPEILSQLRQLTKKLALTPLGFIEITQALSYYLKNKENSPTSAILLGVNSKNICVSLLRVGKIFEQHNLERSDSFKDDAEKAFKGLTATEVLPSRILLYDDEENLEKLQEELIKHPWHQKGAFLHFPKIEIIKKEEIENALVETAGAEIIKSLNVEEFKAEEEIKEEKTIEKEKEESAEGIDEGSEAELAGFMHEKDILSEKLTEEKTEEPRRRTQHLFVKEEPRTGRFNFRLPAVNFKIPSLGKLSMPNFGGFKFLPIIVLVILVIMAGSVYFAYYQLPKAHVSILVSTHDLPKDVDLTFSPNAATVDNANKIIPAKSMEVQESGDKSISTTGKKNIGSAAKGTVTIYNKTLSSKTFPNGTIIMANGFKFSFDADISVASASDTGEGLTYGKTDAKITAATIGPDANLASGASFSFVDFPSSSYTAKNSDALSGGTSREVTVVSSNDQDNLLATLSDDLKAKAKSDLDQKVGGDNKILDKSIMVDIVSKKFDHEVGSEATTLDLTLDAKTTALVYKNSDFNALSKDLFVSDIPNGFDTSAANIDLKINDGKVQKDGSFKSSATVTMHLLPKLPLDDIRKKLAGKSVSQAQDILRNQENVTGVEMSIESPLPFNQNNLPSNPANILLTIASQ